MLAEQCVPGGRREFAAYLSIESAKELLCDERETRAVLLLQHARRVLDTLTASAAGRDGPQMQRGELAARHLEKALSSLRNGRNG